MVKYSWLLEGVYPGHMIRRLTPDFRLLTLQTVTTRGK